MGTRRAALALAATALSAAAVGLPAAAAQGEAPEVGWWTANQIAGLPIGRAALVPPGGSQVASGSDGPVSVAAVRFPAGAGGAGYEVGIELGSDADTATVVACPIVEAWEPVSGAPLSDAPAWDCSLGEVTGTVDPDAATVTWQLPAALVRDGAIDVVLLPTDGAASFTLTMSAPAEDAVTPTPASAPTTTSRPKAGAPSGPTATTASPGPTRAPAPVPAPRLGAGPAPTSSAPVGLPSPLPTTTVAPGSGAELAVAAVPAPSSTSGRVLGGLVLALVACAAAVLVRRATAAAGATPDGRGVGRFVRPRDEPPLPI